MPNPDLGRARRLFEQSENDSDPSQKLYALEEALELVDLVLADSTIQQSDRDLALNLRHSHSRRLLGQLVRMRNIQFDDWWNYIRLLLIERSNEVDAIVGENAELRENYQAFVDLWGDELIEALERVRRARHPTDLD
ncbi:MAG: hypothetical protein CVV14_01525 [Gammaproteobacteria bacterium HGW-Gammaproteobacteria-4]|jgi:hypothetical protein|nr:MAG: hypothetical protein CVV14_01525 [Gammaproteobacteria bacterium HGW-Gammaproteobacteria-4]